MLKRYSAFILAIILFFTLGFGYVGLGMPGAQVLSANDEPDDTEDPDIQPDPDDILPQTETPTETIITQNPEKILSDPNFSLDSVNPLVLEAWYHSTVNIADDDLKSALKSKANISGRITVEDMLNLPKELDLSGQDISNLQGMEYAINVKTLTLSSNKITSLDPLSELYNLENLDFSKNNVRYIPAWIFTSRKLKTVKAVGNGAVSMSAYGGNSGLTELYLDKNDLTALPDMSGCSSLHTLSVTNNALRTFPSTISTLSNLTTLNLSGNQIEEITDVSGLTSLKTLLLDRNKLKKFPAGIEKLSSLGRLSLSQNQIEKIPEQIISAASLETLNLAFNNIKVLPSFLLKANLKTLDVSVNYINPTENQQTIDGLKGKVSSFMYKIQKPNFTLQLVKEKKAPAGKLVWTDISNIPKSDEGELTVTKYVVERVEETLAEEKEEEKDKEKDTEPQAQEEEQNTDTENTETDEELTEEEKLLRERPALENMQVIKELPGTATEYVDTTAEKNVDYTYRVTAYVEGTYGEKEIKIEAQGSEIVNTRDIVKNPVPIWVYILIASIALVGIAVIIILLVLKKKKAKRTPAQIREMQRKKNAKEKGIDKKEYKTQDSENEPVIDPFTQTLRENTAGEENTQNPQSPDTTQQDQDQDQQRTMPISPREAHKKIAMQDGEMQQEKANPAEFTPFIDMTNFKSLHEIEEEQERRQTPKPAPTVMEHAAKTVDKEDFSSEKPTRKKNTKNRKNKKQKPKKQRRFQIEIYDEDDE